MSTEIIVPGTGELVDLSALATDEIAARLSSFAEVVDEIGRFRRAASDELAGRLDHEGRRSGEVGEWKISVNPPTEREWDLDRLAATLDELTEKNLISNHKAQRCIRWKGQPVWSELKNLLSDPRVAPEISLCFTEVPTTRSVRVEKA